MWRAHELMPWRLISRVKRSTPSKPARQLKMNRMRWQGSGPQLARSEKNLTEQAKPCCPPTTS